MRVIRNSLIALFGSYLAGLGAYLALRVLLGDRLWPLALLNNFTALYFFPLIGIVPALGVLRARRIFVAGLILAGIGALWIGPLFVPRPAIVPEGPTLRILTFNALRSNHSIREDAAWILNLNPDVIFLQEMTIYYGPDWIRALEGQYPHRIEQSAGGDMYLATLSRLPLREGERGSILLDFAGQSIAVYNVHQPLPVQVGAINWGAGRTFLQMARNFSVEQRDALIRGLLAVIAQEPRPYIVAGDFNMSDQSAIYGEVAARMRDAFRERGLGFGWSWPVARNANLPIFIPPLVRIDYIWHSDHWRTVEIAQGPALHSDHLPLYATLELNQDAG